MIRYGTAEWYAIRLGRVTASRVSEVNARTKSGWAATRANYMAELIAERLTNTPAEQYINSAMQWGLDHEAEARVAYEFYTDAEVFEGGFVPHPMIAAAGASPDGFVGNDGLVEFKCPLTATHIETLLIGTVPTKYILQMQFQMACSGRRWCDFVSWDPRMPERMRFWIKRYPRDEKLIKALEADVIEFLVELEAKLAQLIARYGHREAA